MRIGAEEDIAQGDVGRAGGVGGLWEISHVGALGPSSTR